MMNAPSAPVTASRVRLVPTFLTVTVAPGMTPPPESVTTPDNLAGKALRVCARGRAGDNHRQRKRRSPKTMAHVPLLLISVR